MPSFEAYYDEEMIWSKKSLERRKAERAVESC
jgi:hypothetical protein